LTTLATIHEAGMQKLELGQFRDLKGQSQRYLKDITTWKKTFFVDFGGRCPCQPRRTND